MRCNKRCVIALAIAVLTSLGCSPALNWREVVLGSTKVMLPCKPDRAQRAVRLGEQTFNMEMVGCEASGALFAASRLEMPLTEQKSTLALWHNASMASLGDAGQSKAALPPMAGNKLLATGHGKAQNGKSIQARFLWQTGSHEVILLAVYAPQIDIEMTEPFQIELKLQ